MGMMTTGAALLTAAATLLGGATTTLPKGFLLWEGRSSGWDIWEVSDRASMPLMLDACHDSYWAKRGGVEKGRVAARTVYRQQEIEIGGEQVALYQEESGARAAMDAMRAELKRCASRGNGIERISYYSKPLKLGDEAVRVGARYWEGGLRQVAVRRGAAIMVYTETAWPTPSLPMGEFATLLKDAKEMSRKVCWLPEAGCQNT
ncbi:hypothetical protein [Nonomuraea africana]|uniref:Uncharacterized protein n=1 Tax=Nonomuraea africana TaxID=46171 RepID=A0ABR9KMD6_9ACTN|nr:hypothetical protein [Nonomuraea africana]MBE1563178.1 hypothetical protein [Nonomuraea africana]